VVLIPVLFPRAICIYNRCHPHLSFFQKFIEKKVGPSGLFSYIITKYNKGLTGVALPEPNKDGSWVDQVTAVFQVGTGKFWLSFVYYLFLNP